LQVKGTQYLDPNEINKRIKSFELQFRKKNINGLQIADLIASPIGRRVLGKETKEDYKLNLNKPNSNLTLFINKNYNGKINNLDKLIIDTDSTDIKFDFNHPTMIFKNKYKKDEIVTLGYSRKQIRDSRRNNPSKKNSNVNGFHILRGIDSRLKFGDKEYEKLQTKFDETKKLYGNFVKSLK